MSNPQPPVPTKPDGTPNYGIIQTQANSGTTSGPDGNLTIWGLPSVLQTENKIIWYKTSVTDGIRGSAGYKVAPSSTQVMANPVDIIKQMYALSATDPSGFIAIQEALANSGAFGAVHVNGFMDHDTEKAINSALYSYYKLSKAGVGMSFTDYLMQAGGSTTSGTPAKKAPSITLADPAEIRARAQQAALSALGESLTPDQLNQFVDQFQDQQMKNHQDAFTASSINLTDEAMAFAQQANPQAYKQNARTQYLDALVNMLGGSAPSASEPVAPVSNAPAGGSGAK